MPRPNSRLPQRSSPCRLCERAPPLPFVAHRAVQVSSDARWLLLLTSDGSIAACALEGSVLAERSPAAAPVASCAAAEAAPSAAEPPSAMRVVGARAQVRVQPREHVAERAARLAVGRCHG